MQIVMLVIACLVAGAVILKALMVGDDKNLATDKPGTYFGCLIVCAVIAFAIFFVLGSLGVGH